MVTNKPFDEPRRSPLIGTPVTQKSKANPLDRKHSNSGSEFCTNKTPTPTDEEADAVIVSNDQQGAAVLS